MRKFKKNFLLNQILRQQKSVDVSKFSFPLLNNGYSKNDLMEGAKTLISGKGCKELALWLIINSDYMKGVYNGV